MLLVDASIIVGFCFVNVFPNVKKGSVWRKSDPVGGATHYAIRIDWMIWKIADPHTTKINSASSHGPTGYFSSAFFVDLGTFPRWVMLRLAFSLAIRILCWGAIVL